MILSLLLNPQQDVLFRRMYTFYMCVLSSDVEERLALEIECAADKQARRFQSLCPYKNRDQHGITEQHHYSDSSS